MRRLQLSHLSSLFRSSSLSHGSSSSPFRPSISSFTGSDARSPMASLHPHRSDLTGSVQLDNQVSGCLDLPQGDSMDVGRQIKVGRAWKALGVMGRSRENVSVPYAVNSKCYVHYDSRINADTGRNFKSMNFVRGILEEDGRDFMAGSPFPRPPNMESNADIVHVKLMRNNTFITVTDNKGNTKLKASAGRLEELKGGPKLSRYAAEAIAEYVGRESRKLGLKSVVMRVKGFTYFKKKRQAIMSWRDGFTDSRSDQNPIVYIEDTTRRAHNGCRLPKQRRV
ncbi:probable ribosomal protein S11, mitochondrial [Momordica charantia]|uniref:Probable ribosomal protein S11, mitochondrial n=1 Tax=Momordica charantia TaxID=3673 RepID=A0A6J1CJJ5_MOMCH|nr:probable ribosomal protein S11, mitochondrial [Momordica charantia]